MSEVIVITHCTERRGMLAAYQEQVERAGIMFHVEHLSSMPHNVGNLGMKIAAIRKFALLYPLYKIILSDAFDIRFYGEKQEVWDKIPDEGILMAAERNLWPDGYLMQYFPKTGTPWMFVNGGLSAGTSESWLKFCDAVEAHPFYFPEMVDQQWFNLLRAKHDPLIQLDSQTNLFYCMVHEQGELEFKYNRPHNTLCGTYPPFVHFNGKWNPAQFLVMEQASAIYHELKQDYQELKQEAAPWLR